VQATNVQYIYATSTSARYCIQYIGKVCPGNTEILDFMFKLINVYKQQISISKVNLNPCFTGIY